MRIGATVLLAMTFAGAVSAQTKSEAQPTKSGPAAQTPAAQTKGSPASPARRIEDNLVVADLAQLMRGMMYPESNVVFSAQTDDPAKYPLAKGDPSMATDLLASTFGKWAAVENSALALSESANLLTLPGRKCANGNPVPIDNADWPIFVQELRDAGKKAYAAAQAKDQDKIIDASDVLTVACANCHRKYREKRERCK